MEDSKTVRISILCFTLFISGLLLACVREGETNERMALSGYIPYRLPGDTRVYWLPRVATVTEEDLLTH